jgi:hypothetical protein
MKDSDLWSLSIHPALRHSKIKVNMTFDTHLPDYTASYTTHPRITAISLFSYSAALFTYVRKGKGKGKGHPSTGHEGPEGEERCSSTLSLTLPLDRGG